MLAVSIGLIILVTGFGVGHMILEYMRPTYPVAAGIMGLVLFLVAVGWVVVGVRLVFGYTRGGKWLKPRMLRIASYCFLLSPFTGFVTGYYKENPVLGPILALTYGFLFYRAQELANIRNQGKEI